MIRSLPRGLSAALLIALLAAPAAAAPARADGDAPPAEKKAAGAEHHHDMKMDMPSKGEPDQGKYMTIVGEVMDPACFLEAGSKSIGPGHFQCAVDCAKSGQTLAIYDRVADRIYFIAGELPGQNPNVPLLPYIHKKVDVSGRVYHRSQAWGIVIIKVAPHVDGAKDAARDGSKAVTRDAARDGAHQGK
ncbi:MAG: hypothetical protein ACM3JJ_10735 [Hyphomicrobiales bacterium]